MGPISKVTEDETPAGILAADPPLDIDLELLLELLDRQLKVWRQEIEQLRSSNTPLINVVYAYEQMADHLQYTLHRVSEFERISSGEAYKINVIKAMEKLKAWATVENDSEANSVLVQTRDALSRTLFTILEEFV